MKVWLNGELVDKADAVVSVWDHGLLYGDGVFEGIRAYNGAVFEHDAHLDRLLASAQLIRLEIPYSKAQLADAVTATIAANGLTDCYIRLVVTRGPGTLGLNPDLCPKPNVFVITDTLSMYSDDCYTRGLPVIIARTVRVSGRMIPSAAKSLNYLNNILAKIEALKAGVMEAVMLNEDGDVCECTGDNIFLVFDGTLVTPPLDASILPGITRAVVLKLARKLGLNVAERTVKTDELFQADEMFLTGTGAEVIAVNRVDDRVIGTGQAGPVTLKLFQAFRDYIAEQTTA